MQPMQPLAGPRDQHFLALVAEGSLSRRQAVVLVALALLFWLMAALFIRYAGPAGLFAGAASAALFALTIPSAWLLIWICKRAAGLGTGQIVAGIALASAAALFCDGVALTWSPSLYGGDRAALLPAAAWLLWGVGTCLTSALISRPPAGGLIGQTLSRAERGPLYGAPCPN